MRDSLIFSFQSNVYFFLIKIIKESEESWDLNESMKV